MKKQNISRKNNLTRYGVALLATLISGSFAATANAHIEVNHPDLTTTAPSQDSFLQDLVTRSEFIFRGELIDISERLSIEKIPYTFVTYRVAEVISGRYANNTITLKFVGGEFENGNRLSASNSPAVKVGEDAVLMVQQSVDTGCDFVDCEKGRFVLENGKVIAANESAVAVNEKGELAFTSLSERNAEGKKAKTNSRLAKSTIAGFIAHIKQLDKATALQKHHTPVETQDIDSHMPFQAYSVLTQAHKAPEVPRNELIFKKAKQLTGSQFDQWEAEQLRLNGGDPLLNHSNNN